MPSRKRHEDLFAKHFERTDRGFLYRRYEGAAGIAISDAEHAQFVETFERRLVWFGWIGNGWFFCGTVAGLAAFANYVLFPRKAAPFPILLGAVAFTLAVLGPIAWWVTDAPARALRGRPAAVAAAPRLPWAQAQKSRIVECGWYEMFRNALIAASFAFTAVKTRFDGPWSYVSAIVLVAGLALSLVEIALKIWWATRRPPIDPTR